jgi:hypothetical protein
VEGGDEAGWAGWFDVFDGGEKALQMCGSAGGRDFEVELVGADGKTCGIALVDEEVCQRGCDAAGVFDLRFLAGTVEIHRAGGVDHEVGAEVGIGLEFLDVETSERAKAFQSRRRVSSPGTYFRYSANSTDDPRWGERCFPATFPIMGTRDSIGREPRRERRSESMKEWADIGSGFFLQGGRRKSGGEEKLKKQRI